MNIADFIVLGLLAVFLIIGSSRGLMLSVFSLASYFLAIVLAIKFSPAVARLLGKTSIFITVKTKIADFFDKVLEDFVNDSIQMQIDQLVSKMNLTNSIQDKMDIEKIRETSTTTAGMVDTLSDKLANLIMLVIAFVIIYIAAKIALFIVSEIIKKTSKLPVIRSFDKLGGLFFGLIEGVIVIWVIFMVLFMFRASETLRPIFELINDSKVASFLYRNNIVLNLVSGYISKIQL